MKMLHWIIEAVVDFGVGKKSLARVGALSLGLSFLLVARTEAVDILTHHNDQWRTGSNLVETGLRPSNVSVSSFGKLFSYAVDGAVYGQPLYVEGLNISGGVHNVVYVVTMEDSVYAFDADTNVTYWYVNFTGGSIVPVPVSDITGNPNLNIHGNAGILSTPVIDRTSGTIYLLARTKDTSNSTYQQKLHALNLATGAEKFGGPVTTTTTGFDPKKQNQRAALGLYGGKVYIAWSSHEDIGPYHGWIMAYNATTLAQVSVFNPTPSGNMAAIWQAGQGPAFDNSGNLYVITGNGDWNGTTNFGQSFLKLSPTLGVLDWFTPDNYAALNSSDKDFGAAGVLILPSGSGYPSTQYVIGGGKEGKLFVLSKAGGGAMGHMTAGNTGAHQVFQAVATGSCSYHIHGSPVYWNSASLGQTIYVWGENDVGKAFHFNGSTFTTTPSSTTTVKSPTTGCGMPGSILSVSANGNTDGIIWANCVYTGDAVHNIVPGILRAYDANNLATELWNSRMNLSRDDLGNLAKYVPPTVVNGKVYMATFSNKVNVYGSLNGPLANGIYSLQNRSSGKSLDNLNSSADGSNVGQYTTSSSNNQNWTFTYAGGYYRLACVSTGKYVDSIGHTADGDTVGQTSSTGGSSQQWTVTDLGTGYYKVVNRANGKCLDSGGSTGNTPLVFMPSSSSTTQQWQITP